MQQALREAVINALIHNDYSYEAPPKFELFSDRIEITSIGSLPLGMSRDDFFSGMSMPRNKELMRVFKDMKMVEYLGSGIPRILKTYDRSCFVFGDNFIRIVLRYEEGYEVATSGKEPVEGVNGGVFSPQVTPQVTPQVARVLAVLKGEMSREELQTVLQLKDRKSFSELYLLPAIKEGLVEMTIPDKPNSRLQRYRLTEKGKRCVG